MFEIRVTVVPVFNKIFIGAEARSGSGDINLGGRGGHGRRACGDSPAVVPQELPGGRARCRPGAACPPDLQPARGRWAPPAARAAFGGGAPRAAGRLRQAPIPRVGTPFTR